MRKTKRQIKRLWTKYVVSVSLALNVLLFLSVVTVVLHDFVFTGRPELFRGGAQIWDLACRLSLALIGSYIFYFVVVHLKRQQDKENLLPFLQRQTNAIVGDAKSVIRSIERASGHDLAGDYPEPEDTQAMCATINALDKAPGFLGDAWRSPNWLEYLGYYKNRTKGAIWSVYVVVPFLDSDHLKLLADVDDSSFFGLLDALVGTRIRNNFPLSDLPSELLHDYFNNVKALEEYANKRLV